MRIQLFCNLTSTFLRKYSNRCGVVLRCGCNFHFSHDWWSWASFHVLFAFHVASSVRCLFRNFAHFLKCIVCFLIVEFWQLFMYCEYNPFVRNVICRCFSPSLWLVLFSFTVSSSEQKILINPSLSIFVVLIVLSVSCVRSLCLTRVTNSYSFLWQVVQFDILHLGLYSIWSYDISCKVCISVHRFGM